MKKNTQIVTLNGPVDNNLIPKLGKVFASCDRDKPVALLWSSSGGNPDIIDSVVSFFRIAEKSFPELLVVNSGIIASAATDIFIQLENRACLNKATFMIHNASLWTMGQMDSDDIEIEAREIKRINREGWERYKKHLKLSKKDWQTIKSNKDLNIRNNFRARRVGLTNRPVFK